MVYTKKRVQSHVLEKIIGVLMAMFGIAAIWLFLSANARDILTAGGIVIVEILLLIVLAILAQTVVLIQIYEQRRK